MPVKKNLGPYEFRGLEISYENTDDRFMQFSLDQLKHRLATGQNATKGCSLRGLLELCDEEGNFKFESKLGGDSQVREGRGVRVSSIIYSHHSNEYPGWNLPWEDYVSLGRPEQIMVERIDTAKLYP